MDKPSLYIHCLNKDAVWQKYVTFAVLEDKSISRAIFHDFSRVLPISAFTHTPASIWRGDLAVW